MVDGRAYFFVLDEAELITDDEYGHDHGAGNGALQVDEHLAEAKGMATTRKYLAREGG